MQKVTAQITEALRSRADWIFGSVEESAEREDEVGRLSLLDYACGTGTVTRVCFFVLFLVFFFFRGDMVRTHVLGLPRPSSIPEPLGHYGTWRTGKKKAR